MDYETGKSERPANELVLANVKNRNLDAAMYE